MKRVIFVVILFLIQAIAAHAGNINGIRGPVYLIPGWNLLKGDLVIHGHSRFYFKNEVHELQDQPTQAVTFWDAQGSFNIFYGIGKYYGIELAQVIYQDNHKGGKGYNLPDDLYLKIKVASLGTQTMPFNFGVQLSSRIPTAKHHNIPFEPYSAGKLEFSIMGLASYSQNLLNPEDTYNLHVNIGYLDHNDAGAEINTTSSSSKEFIYGAGIVYPVTKFDFSLEVYGNRHLSRPPEAAYSRYNYVYVTPGITYHPYYWLSVVFGFDYRLTAARPNQSAHTISQSTPVFPTWRVNLGVKINLMSKLSNRFDKKEKSLLPGTKTEPQSIYKQIADERKQVEDAERELEKIKNERKKMDDMLKRLRNILEYKEEQKKKSEPENK